MSSWMVCALAAMWGIGSGVPNGTQRGGQESQMGKTPICDAGPDQVVECTGPITAVQLDGTGSSNPVGGELAYFWEVCGDPRVTIDDRNSPTPVLSVDMQGTCSVSCTVFLIVSSAFGSSVCSLDVTVQDTTPPALTCPPDVVVNPGDPTDPGSTGMATATDACGTPVVTFADDTSTPGVIARTWTADDGCTTSQCTQLITIFMDRDVHFDLFPGQCPNLVEILTEAVVPSGVLGNALDVTQVDLGTVRVRRPDDGGTGVVAPILRGFQDVGAPFVGALCDCDDMGPDGDLDAFFIFDRSEFVSALQLDLEPNGAVIVLEVTGQMIDGTFFSGLDCIEIFRP